MEKRVLTGGFLEWRVDVKFRSDWAVEESEMSNLKVALLGARKT